MTGMRNAVKNKWHIAAIAMILAAGAAVRIAGINYVDFSQTDWNKLDWILNMRDAGLKPVRYFHPPLHMMLTVILFHIIYLSGKLAGTFADWNAFIGMYIRHPQTFFIMGRLTALFMGCIVIVPVYMLGKKFFGTITGLAGALFLAACPIHIDMSQTVRQNTTVAFFTVLTVYSAIRSLDESGRRWLFLTGLASGFAFAADYPSALLALPVALTIIFIGKNRNKSGLSPEWPKLIAAVFFGVVSGTMLASPHYFFDCASVFKDFMYQVRNGIDAPGVSDLPGWGFGTYFLLLFKQQPIMSILSLIGIAVSVISKKQRNLILMVYPVSFILFFSCFAQKTEKFIIPAIPFIALLAGYTADTILTFASKKGRLIFTVAVVFAIIIAASQVVSVFIISSEKIRYSEEKDTRLQLAEWANKNIPDGAGLLLTGRTSPVFGLHRTIPQLEYELRTAAFNRKIKVEIEMSKSGEWRPARYELLAIDDTSHLSADIIKLLGFDYVVISELPTAIQTSASPKKESEITTWLETENEQVASFRKENSSINGPDIFVYKITDSGDKGKKYIVKYALGLLLEEKPAVNHSLIEFMLGTGQISETDMKILKGIQDAVKDREPRGSNAMEIVVLFSLLKSTDYGTLYKDNDKFTIKEIELSENRDMITLTISFTGDKTDCELNAYILPKGAVRNAYSSSDKFAIIYKMNAISPILCDPWPALDRLTDILKQYEPEVNLFL